jgi:2-hydroxycyclohexanecarboxyl-CoA dehydrogenase
MRAPGDPRRIAHVLSNGAADQDALMDFAGKVAVVTGGGAGIGKALCRMLAERGAAVAILDIDERAAGETVDEIKAEGGSGLAVRTNVAVKAEVDAAIDKVLAELGRIDILVNNAGWTANQPFVEDTPEYWDKVIDINYKAQIYTCRAVIDPMMRQGGGAIVNVASDAARVGSPRQSVYAGAKAGVIGFSKALTTEISKHGIRVNVVSPSTTDTPLTREALSPEQIERREKVIPMRRIGQPEDQASAMLFLASDAAGYITGQVLSVNGGSSRLG